jgi:hypothetical protein
MTKTSVDLLGGHQPWFLATSIDVVGHFWTIRLWLVEELNVAIFLGTGCINNLLLSINLVGALKIMFELGKEHMSIIPMY